MTFHEKLQARIQAARRNGREPVGLVVDDELYEELLSSAVSPLVPIYRQYNVSLGDTYMGLEVSISSRKGAFTVY